MYCFSSKPELFFLKQKTKAEVEVFFNEILKQNTSTTHDFFHKMEQR